MKKLIAATITSGILALGVSGLATAGTLKVPVDWGSINGQGQDYYYVLTMTDQNGNKDTFTLTPRSGADFIEVRNVAAGDYTLDSWAYRLNPGLNSNKVHGEDLGPRPLTGTVTVSDSGVTVFPNTLKINKYYDSSSEKFITYTNFM